MHKKWQERFYNSKEWKQVRAYMINKSKGICAACGDVIIGSPEIHHTVELTELNVSNPNISLNIDLLEVLHKECHNKRHERYMAKEKEIITDDDLNIDYSKRKV